MERANPLLQSPAMFFATFDIQEEDEMYFSEDKRPQVWKFLN
jgi:predicted metalloendopeptidase